jgi:hypothetical protein
VSHITHNGTLFSLLGLEQLQGIKNGLVVNNKAKLGIIF